MAVLLAVALGALAIYSFSSSPHTGTSTSVVTTVTTSTSVVVATSTATVVSRTIPPIQTYTSGVAVPLDPSLVVNPVQGLLQTSANATQIAQAMASKVNELPIRLVSEQLPTCSGAPVPCSQATNPYYLYETAANSNISITLVQGKFYEIDYITQNYYKLTGGSATSTTGSAFNSTKADGQVRQIVNDAFGLPLQSLSLVDQLPPRVSSTDYVIQWGQEYEGLPIANSGVVYFEFYPPTGQLIRMIIDEGSGWYSIPPNFPLTVQASEALNSVAEYATDTLHMNLVSYTDVSLQIVQNHMYYGVTVSNDTNSYLVFVNPRTGEIGFPRS